MVFKHLSPFHKYNQEAALTDPWQLFISTLIYLPKFSGLLSLKYIKYKIILFYSCKEINMSAAHPPELKKFMDKKVLVKLPTGMTVEGVLRGFDPFMNMVLDESIGTNKAGEKESIGMIVVRGNSCVMMEAKDRIF